MKTWMFFFNNSLRHTRDEIGQYSRFKMSFDLERVFTENLNLYRILGFKEEELHEQLTTNHIKKQYRSLALVHHPDKQPDNPESLHRFHLISLATHVLTDKSLRERYDRWLSRTQKKEGEDEHRTGLIEKLRKSEADAAGKQSAIAVADVSNIQEYGESLRKLKHFNLPYGNWRQPQQTSSTTVKLSNSHRLYESSTLRIELTNDGSITDNQSLKDKLEQIFARNPLYDIYFSSRNDFQYDETVVAYVVFTTPEHSHRVFDSFKSSSDEESWGSVVDISPRIPLHYYSEFTLETQMDESILNMINNEPIIID